MGTPRSRLFTSQPDGADAGRPPITPTSPQAMTAARASAPAATPTPGTASASHVATDGPHRGRLMQIQDDNRADASGSKPRPPKSPTERRPRVSAEDDALLSPAPQTDDTPTIISRNGPANATPPDPDGIRGRRLAHFELL